MDNSRSEQIYDEWLILRSQGGESQAVGKLVMRWQPRLLQFAGIVTREPDMARDAVQDAWLAIMRGLVGLKDPASFRSWMFRIVHNKCIDQLRLRGQSTEIEPSTLPEQESALDAVETKEQIATVLASLSEHHRAVLALHYLYDMEVAEISDLLGVAVGTIKSRLFNGREAFRQVLVNEGGNDEPRSKDRASIA